MEKLAGINEGLIILIREIVCRKDSKKNKYEWFRNRIKVYSKRGVSKHNPWKTKKWFKGEPLWFFKSRNSTQESLNNV